MRVVRSLSFWTKPWKSLGFGNLRVAVLANQTDPLTATAGGTTEFELANPVVALIGSNQADAPYLVFHVDATGYGSIVVSYRLRDLEGAGGGDNSTQQVALHFRTGGMGTWTNVPAGYVVDATIGPGLTKETLVSVPLPAAAENTGSNGMAATSAATRSRTESTS